MRPFQPWLLVPLLLIAVVVFAPRVAAALLAINLLALLVAGAARLVAAVRARAYARTAPVLALPIAEEPFVSVHVPIGDEPPEVVRRTLDSLARLRYRRYEVIVLADDTADPAPWEPVAAHCRELGPRFRFRHVDRVDRAKARASSLRRSITDPRADHVLVIDADYRVERSLLARARRYLTPGVSFVQFPRAYANATDGSAGLSDEHASYFDLFVPFADARDCALLIGPPCLVRVEALDGAGGWGADALTEPAGLGLRLQLGGARGRYAPEVAGGGLMPTDLESLRRQRRRWVAGHAQTLRTLRLADLRRFGPRRAFAVLVQLTASLDFWLAPLSALLVCAFLPLDGARGLAASLAGATVALQLGLALAAMAMAPPIVEGRPRRTLRAFLVHLGMLWEGATAWVDAWLGRRAPSAGIPVAPRARSLREVLPQLAVATAMLGASVAYAARGHLQQAVLAAVASAALSCVLYLRRELGRVPRPSFASPPPMARTGVRGPQAAHRSSTEGAA